ncbi:MAG: gamma-butyrobetaine,2-oxoglutarate dioxygenase [Hyphomonadaceae bacterium]|nr:gamma-butyrobetaine,2-oxoglutarate dioxygenase [Hyphomonadaceae bacterium]
MKKQKVNVKLDTDFGGIVLRNTNNASKLLHPLWIRERTEGPADFDTINYQRLYDHSTLPADLKITQCEVTDCDRLDVEFNDGYQSNISLTKIQHEIGWRENPEDLPVPKPWKTGFKFSDHVKWSNLNDPLNLKAMLDDFLTYGFCIMRDTPTERDCLLQLASRFGYVRDTNWGKIFNVETKPDATDAAYKDVALAAHTDNPYRDPIPGIQFLHCLTNDVSGGLSTLVDGIAVADRLHDEEPEQARILEDVIVRYRYQGPSAILENFGPTIERDHIGIVRRIRLSSRVDFVPALDPKTLNLFYAGRRRLNELSNSPEFQISFPFRPGTLLMMDNYRLLHGRTAFDGKQGHRLLQGCYTDHDGVCSLYKLLANGRDLTSVARED